MDTHLLYLKQKKYFSVQKDDIGNTAILKPKKITPNSGILTLESHRI